jgi:competence protein ComEC
MSQGLVRKPPIVSGLPPSIRAVPALTLACGFAAGILLRNSGFPGWVLATALVLGIGWTAVAAVQARRRLVTLLPLALFGLILTTTLTAGFVRLEMSMRVQPNDVRKLLRVDPADVAIYGRILTEPTWRDGRVRFQLTTREVQRGDSSISVRGRIQVVADRESRDGLHAGQPVRVQGMISPPAIRRNPADFDYGGFLARQEIHSILRVRTDGVELTEGSMSWVDRVLRRTRLRIRDAIETNVPSPGSRTIVYALTLGDRSGLSPEERERFARSGLMHLLAVSGLHVMLVGMVVYRLLRPGLMRMRLSWRTVEVARGSLTIGLLIGYMMVTGNSPSVVRAVVMASVFIVGASLERRSHPLNTIGIAALVLLAFRPFDLFQVGFQLSFSAVLSIILFSPAIPTGAKGSKMHPAIRYATQSIAVSVAATIGTMPALLFHFGRTSFAGLILNLGAIPTTAALLSSSLAMILTAGIPPLGTTFGAAANFLAALLIKMAGTGDVVFRWALVDVFVRDPFLLAAIGGTVVLPSIWSFGRARWKYMISILALLVASLWTFSSSPRSGTLDILFFDVGQADAALVTFPNGSNMLVDVGRRDFGFDAGDRVIVPHLKRFGIRRIDAVVITHPHNDHLGGLPSLLRQIPVHRVLDNGDDYDSAVYRESVQLIEENDIMRSTLRTGDTISIDPRVRILVLGPDESVGYGVNDRSVVLQIAYGNHRILLTGDAEHAAEAVLRRSFFEILSSDLIKVGHHGSSTSSGDGFVPLVATADRETHAVVSVGFVNRYRHPNPDVLDRWRSHGGLVHKTSLNGAIWFRSDGLSLERVDWRR